MTTLYIIRGLPGSGKSTLAKTLQKENVIENFFEADMYFIENGEYNFNPSKIKYAHEWCFMSVVNSLMGEADTAVSNTFTQKWEAQRYIDFCKENEIDVHIITCTNEYGSIHAVPEESMKKMRDRFETDTSGWLK